MSSHYPLIRRAVASLIPLAFAGQAFGACTVPQGGFVNILPGQVVSCDGASSGINMASTNDNVQVVVYSGTLAFSNVDLGGLCEKISFSPKDHRPQSTEAVYKIGPAGNLVLEPPSRTIAMDPAWLGW